jgi:hypothetical protein
VIVLVCRDNLRKLLEEARRIGRAPSGVGIMK